MIIRSSLLFVSPVTNFSSWQKIILLYNFSELLCRLNNIETLFTVLGYFKDWTKRNVHAGCALVYFWSHVHKLSFQGISPGYYIGDFFTGTVKKLEFFGGEALIFTKFFRGKPIFFRVRTHILQGQAHILWKSSGVNAILARVGVRMLNAIAQYKIIDPYINQY